MLNYEEKIEKIKNCEQLANAKVNFTWKNRCYKKPSCIAARYVLAPLATNKKAIAEINSLFYDFLWSGRGDKIKGNTCMLNDYSEGRLKMLDIESFNKALKMTWVKKYLDKENHSKWKIFDLEIKNNGESTILTGNLNKKI